MRATILLLAALLIPYAVLAQISGGRFSKAATTIWGNPDASYIIRSPDERKSIVLERNPDRNSDEQYFVRIKVDDREFRSDIGSMVNSEVLWSPDSRAFFINYSDGGLVGTYHTKVYYLTSSGYRIVEPIPNGRKLFAPNCFTPERPNIVAIDWIGGSQRVLIAAIVPPHSSCANMGTFRAFEIALPVGTVIRHYGQIRAKKVFGHRLGDALVIADDNCIRNPQKCMPPGLNEGKARF